jgi:hypothetical protein
MGTIYEAAYWSPLEEGEVEISEMHRLAAVLECRLWIDSSTVFVDNYQSFALVISADQEEFIRLYREAIAAYGYADFRPSHRLNALPEHYKETKGIFPGFLQNMRLRNQRIQKNLPLWVAGYIDAGDLNRARLETMIEFACERDISMSYRVVTPASDREEGYPLLEMFFKILRYQNFHISIDELGKDLLLNSWRLHVLDFNEEGYFETLPQLTPETLDVFLQAIGYTDHQAKDSSV